MLFKKQEIIEYLTDYTQQKNNCNCIWYIGICQEAHDIVFEALKRTSLKWTYIETGSKIIAKEVFEHFVNLGIIKKDFYNPYPNEIGSIIYVYQKQHDTPYNI